MPSKSEPQARFMAACAHGAGYSSCPSDEVSHEFNQADKGSALLSHAMKHNYAAGGPTSPLSSLVGNPMTMRSSMPHLGQPFGGQHMRMPHVPLAGTLHNIDQHMAGARVKMPHLKARGGRTGYDEGGEVRTSSSPGSPGVTGAIHDALAALRDYVIDRPAREIAAERDAHDEAVMSGAYSGPTRATPQGDYARGGNVPGAHASGAIRAALAHLANKDASSAAAALHSSPEAMQHPVVRLAAHALRTGHGLAPATQDISAVAGALPPSAG